MPHVFVLSWQERLRSSSDLNRSRRLRNLEQNYLKPQNEWNNQWFGFFLNCSLFASWSENVKDENGPRQHLQLGNQWKPWPMHFNSFYKFNSCVMECRNLNCLIYFFREFLAYYREKLPYWKYLARPVGHQKTLPAFTILHYSLSKHPIYLFPVSFKLLVSVNIT